VPVDIGPPAHPIAQPEDKQFVFVVVSFCVVFVADFGEYVDVASEGTAWCVERGPVFLLPSKVIEAFGIDDVFLDDFDWWDSGCVDVEQQMDEIG